MILNFVPSSAFIAFGYCDDVEPPVAPIGTSRCLASSIVLMPEVYQVTVVLFSARIADVDELRRVELDAACRRSPAASDSDWSAVASTVPSFGAML